jgi:uncharacterized membrane protein
MFGKLWINLKKYNFFKAMFKNFKTKIEKNLLWFILLLASLLRFFGLVKRDFWYDEAFTGVAVKENFSNMIGMIINDVHPPLYYMALKFFASFFGYSVFGIRLFSAIFGVLSVWAVYLVAREMFNKKVALWSAFITAISPFAIQYSQEARMYAMLVFLILISTYFFIKALKSNEVKYYILWGVFIGLSMLTHYMGLIFSITYLLGFIVWNFFRKYEFYRDKNYTNIGLMFLKNSFPDKKIFLGYLVGFVVFLPWLNNFIHHLTMKGNNLSWVKPANFGDIVTTLQMFLFGTPLGEMSSGMPQPNEIGFVSGGMLHMVSQISIKITLAVLFGMTIVWLGRKEKKEKISMLLVFSIGFLTIVYLISLFSSEQQYFVARYLLPGGYFFFIYVGLVLSYLEIPLISLSFAIYFAMLFLIVPLKNSTGYNEMIRNMDKYKNNNFYILNSFDYVITKYYFGGEKLTLYNYDWPEYNPSYWAAIGEGLKRTEKYSDLRNDPKALIISNKPLNRDNQYFSTEGLELVDKYNNILVYKFK